MSAFLFVVIPISPVSTKVPSVYRLCNRGRQPRVRIFFYRVMNKSCSTNLSTCPAMASAVGPGSREFCTHCFRIFSEDVGRRGQ